jgi:1,4-alpha-glucan branching enzyme
MTTASDYLHNHPPQAVLHLPEGSWGPGGTNFTWDNAETHWMWVPIGEAERRMEVLVENFQEPMETELAVLNQAARELLLLQSSDWQSLITTGQAKEYAIQRFTQHLDRFNQLADSIDNGKPAHALAVELWEKDKVFPDIDYRWFKAI